MKRLALLVIILALLPGVITAQGPLELDSKAEMQPEGGNGRLTFKYPDEWELLIVEHGYLSSRSGLVPEFNFQDDDILVFFREFTQHPLRYDYNSRTDATDYVRAVIAGDPTLGANIKLTDGGTIGTFNVLRGVYEAQGLEIHVFGMYEEGKQPLIVQTLGLPGAYDVHEETILAILETVEFVSHYDLWLDSVYRELKTVDFTDARDMPIQGEKTTIVLTEEDPIGVFTFEAEADTLAYFRVDRTSSAHPEFGPSMLLLNSEGKVYDFQGTQWMIAEIDGEREVVAFSEWVVHFTEAGVYTMLVSINGIVNKIAGSGYATFDVIYEPVEAIPGNAPLDIIHSPRQTHVFVSEALFEGPIRVIASTPDDINLPLDVRATYLDSDSVDFEDTDSYQDGNETSTSSIVSHILPDGQPAQILFVIREDPYAERDNSRVNVDTTLTITIEPVN